MASLLKKLCLTAAALGLSFATPSDTVINSQPVRLANKIPPSNVFPGQTRQCLDELTLRLINDFNARHKAERVIDISVYYDEEFEQAFQNPQQAILTYLDFAADNFQKQTLNGKPLNVTFNIHSIAKWDSDDNAGSSGATLEEFILETEEPAGVEASIVFSREKNDTYIIGLADPWGAHILVNDPSQNEYLTVLHELFHLLGAADRDILHPLYDVESIMSYKHADSTTKLDDINQKIVFYNRDRSWRLAEEDNDTMLRLLGRYQGETKEKIMGSYIAIFTGKDLEETRKTLSELTSLYPQDSDLFFLLGQVNYYSIHYFDAEAAYKQSLNLDPTNVSSLNSLAWLYAERWNVELEEALKLARKAYALSPDSVTIRDTYALALYKNGQLKEARLLAEQNFKLAPFDYSILKTLGFVQMDSGMLPEAQKTFEIGVWYAGENPESYHNLGEVFFRQKNYQSALEKFIFADGLCQKVETPFGVQIIGRASYSHLEKIVEVYEKIRTDQTANIFYGHLLDKKAANYYATLSFDYSYKIGIRFEEALSYAQTAHSLDVNAYTKDALAWALHKNSKTQEAIYYERDAITMEEKVGRYERLLVMLSTANQEYSGELERALQIVSREDTKELNSLAGIIIENLPAYMFKAQGLLEDSLSINSAEPSTYELYGKYHYGQGEYQQAITRFNESIPLWDEKKDKTDIGRQHYNISLCYTAMGNNAAAQQELELSKQFGYTP